MTVFFNLLFIFVSVLFFAGRLYEVLFLLEEETFFLTQNGIVTTPLMLGIVFLISICCGVLIFSDKKFSRKPLKIPVGIFGFAAAILFIASSVFNLIRIFTVTGGFLGYDIMMILASAGLVIYGIKGIRGKNSEKLPMILTILYPMALCMHSVILNVQPIANTYFLYRSLAAITSLVFIMLLYKNAYSPSAMARPMLYIASLLNYLISGAAMLAGIIGGIANSYVDKADLLLYAGLAVMGAYSLFVSFYIAPTAEKSARKQKAAVEEVEEDEWEYEEDEDVKEYAPVYPAAKPVTDYDRQPAHENPVFSQDTGYRNANRISEDTIALLFAQKDEKERQQKVDTAVKDATVDFTATQAVERKAAQPARPVPKAEERKPVQKTEKSVFRSTGTKKPASTKTVYKAPKK